MPQFDKRLVDEPGARADRQRDRRRTEARLKDAAITVWAEHSYHGASVAQIADAAQANVSLISRYFGGKQGLLLAIVEDMIEEKQAGELEYAPQETLQAELLAYMRFRYSEDLRRSDLVRIVMSEIATNRDFRARALSTFTHGADENFQARLKALQSAGRIRRDADLTELFRAISLFSFASGFIEGIILGLPTNDTDALLVQFTRAIAREYGG